MVLARCDKLLFDEYIPSGEVQVMRYFDAEAVRRHLPMPRAIAAMARAFAAYSAGRVEMPLRLRLSVPDHDAVVLHMPAYLHDEQGEALAVKVVSVYPHNPAQGHPMIYATVLVLEPHTGRPLAVLEGSTLTAIRTGAASGLATRLLAREDAHVLAVFGAGVQARSHIRAVCTVRSIERVWVYAPTRAHVEALIQELAGQGPIPGDMRAAESPSQALAEADIVCTTTTSATPVFAEEDLRPGTHINAVGSYTPHMVEIPLEVVARAYVVVDSRESARAEAGEIAQALARGLLSENDLVELGDIVLGRRPGRTHRDQITLFKSVGLAVQDVVAARAVLENAGGSP